jgi:hypothetical protein
MLCPFLEKTEIQNQTIPIGNANNKLSHCVWHWRIIAYSRFDYVFIYLLLSNCGVAFGMNAGTRR